VLDGALVDGETVARAAVLRDRADADARDAAADATGARA